MRSITFSVLGKAQPAGSKRIVPIGRPGGKQFHRVIDDNPKAAGWKLTVGRAARVAMQRAGLVTPGGIAGPCHVEMIFFRQRPQFHMNSKGEVAPRFVEALPTTKPDALKLARAVEDAMTGITYSDDAMIVREVLQKRYSDADGPAGVHVTVTWP